MDIGTLFTCSLYLLVVYKYDYNLITDLILTLARCLQQLGKVGIINYFLFGTFLIIDIVIHKVPCVYWFCIGAVHVIQVMYIFQVPCVYWFCIGAGRVIQVMYIFQVPCVYWFCIGAGRVIQVMYS